MMVCRVLRICRPFAAVLVLVIGSFSGAVLASAEEPRVDSQPDGESEAAAKDAQGPADSGAAADSAKKDSAKLPLRVVLDEADTEGPPFASRSGATHQDARPSASASPDEIREALTLDLGPVRLVPLVILAAQATPLVGDDANVQSGDVADRPGFRLRRARLGLGGDLLAQTKFQVSGELGTLGELRVHDAWVAYEAWKWLGLVAGLHDVPFSRSALVSAADTALTDRALSVYALAPFEQVGMNLNGRLFDGALQYTAGLYNGFQRTDQFYRGYAQDSAPLGNRFEGIAYAGRIASEPLGALGETIEDRKGDFRVGAGADFFLSDGGARSITGASADVLLKGFGFHLLGEFLWNRSKPKDVPTQASLQIAPISSYGIVTEIGYMPIRRRLGLNLRFEWVESNTAIADESDNALFTGGATYYLVEDFLRTQLEFTHREERFGTSLSNDSLTAQLGLKL